MIGKELGCRIMDADGMKIVFPEPLCVFFNFCPNTSIASAERFRDSQVRRKDSLPLLYDHGDIRRQRLLSRP